MSVEKFARVLGNNLHTATRTYKKGEKTVRLVSAIHVGERQYYEDLCTDLSGCERILYEGIMPAEVSQPYRALSFVYHCYNLLDRLGDSVTRTFDLQRQAKYMKPCENWENADINIVEMVEAAGIFSKTNVQASGQFLKVCMALLYTRVLKNPEAKRAFLQGIIRGITSNDMDLGLFNARDLGESVAIHKIGESLKTYDSLGVLYGAGHMQTIENFVTRDLGYLPDDVM